MCEYNIAEVGVWCHQHDGEADMGSPCHKKRHSKIAKYDVKDKAFFNPSMKNNGS